MNHQLINTGAGWRCLRCKVAWDQGDDAPETCEAGDEYGFVTDQVPEPERFVDWMMVEGTGDDMRSRPLTEAEKATFSTSITDFDSVRLGVNSQSTYLRDLMDDATKVPIDVVDTLTDYEKKFLPFRPPTSAPTTPAMQQHIEQIAPYVTGESFDRAFPRPNALQGQVGGDWYKTLAIQPTEFCMRNGLDAAIHGTLKYLTRWRQKDGLKDLSKGRHFVEIREAFPYDIHPPRQIAITMLEYVTRNNIRPDDAEALYRLEAYYNAVGHHARIGADRLISEIDRLIARAG